MDKLQCRRAAALRTAAFLTVSLAASGPAFASCGSAFCMVNTNWNVQGVWTEPGGKADLRYEYINQDQPMSGNRKVAVGEVPRDHDEVRTVNKNWIASVDYQFSPEWGLTATAPVGNRDHVHIPSDEDPATPETWRFTKLGDVRVLGRYQRMSEHADDQRMDFQGLNFGLKLPTGKTDVTNSAGSAAERTLQPGTGTTDALFGGYFTRMLPGMDLTWFAQALYQRPMNSHADYKPGTRLSADFGMRYDATPDLGLMVQLNLLHRGRDSGAQAEPYDSGGRFVFASAGASYTLTRNLQVYGFVQLPLYQYVNGVQLTASKSLVVGVSSRF